MGRALNEMPYNLCEVFCMVPDKEEAFGTWQLMVLLDSKPVNSRIGVSNHDSLIIKYYHMDSIL